MRPHVCTLTYPLFPYTTLFRSWGLPPQFEAKLEEMGIDGRMRRWIDQQRQLAGRQPRRYATIDEALARMQEDNRHLSPDRARQLTLHGVAQKEAGSNIWKFDRSAESRGGKA